MLTSFGVEKAARGIELAEVESENDRVRFVVRVRGGIETAVCAAASESPDFI